MTSEEKQILEQAYRRGFHQGYFECLKNIHNYGGKVAQKHLKKVWDWRVSKNPMKNFFPPMPKAKPIAEFWDSIKDIFNDKAR